MRSAREAEKAEQQRIKKLVLNYDLRSGNSEPGTESHTSTTLSANGTAGGRQGHDGEDPFSYVLRPNPNHSSRMLLRNYALKPSAKSPKDKFDLNAETMSAYAGGAGSNGTMNNHSRTSSRAEGPHAGAQSTDAKHHDKSRPASGRRAERQQHGAKKLSLGDLDW